MYLFDTDLYALGQHERIGLFRRVGAALDDGGLISNLQVWENVLLPAAYHRGRQAADIEADVLGLFQALGYGEEATRRLMACLPDELTTYEKRLAALARAMLMDPDVMAYDFLLSGLGRDEASRLLAQTARFHARRSDRLSVYVCPDDARPRASTPT